MRLQPGWAVQHVDVNQATTGPITLLLNVKATGLQPQVCVVCDVCRVTCDVRRPHVHPHSRTHLTCSHTYTSTLNLPTAAFCLIRPCPCRAATTTGPPLAVCCSQCHSIALPPPSPSPPLPRVRLPHARTGTPRPFARYPCLLQFSTTRAVSSCAMPHMIFHHRS